MKSYPAFKPLPFRGRVVLFLLFSPIMISLFVVYFSKAAHSFYYAASVLSVLILLFVVALAEPERNSRFFDCWRLTLQLLFLACAAWVLAVMKDLQVFGSWWFLDVLFVFCFLWYVCCVRMDGFWKRLLLLSKLEEGYYLQKFYENQHYRNVTLGQLIERFRARLLLLSGVRVEGDEVWIRWPFIFSEMPIHDLFREIFWYCLDPEDNVLVDEQSGL